ncbi:MAG: hypothetical protein METHP_01640 [Methanoregula sp. SKADARSKE-2]|nr:MAG: hypothetical protein METHP_01640 [Methanoregula sp. SKADARSKE-2]
MKESPRASCNDFRDHFQRKKFETLVELRVKRAHWEIFLKKKRARYTYRVEYPDAWQIA